MESKGAKWNQMKPNGTKWKQLAAKRHQKQQEGGIISVHVYAIAIVTIGVNNQKKSGRAQRRQKPSGTIEKRIVIVSYVVNNQEQPSGAIRKQQQ